MECFAVVFILFLVAFYIVIDAVKVEQNKVAKMSPAEKDEYLEALRDRQLALEDRQRALGFGPINPAMICQHCHEKGKIRTKHVVQKKGISGGKAAAALVTGGLSVLATGLSRKEGLTQAHCDNCSNTWFY